jgi:hypothetical protein
VLEVSVALDFHCMSSTVDRGSVKTGRRGEYLYLREGILKEEERKCVI